MKSVTTKSRGCSWVLLWQTCYHITMKRNLRPNSALHTLTYFLVSSALLSSPLLFLQCHTHLDCLYCLFLVYLPIFKILVPKSTPLAKSLLLLQSLPGKLQPFWFWSLMRASYIHPPHSQRALSPSWDRGPWFILASMYKLSCVSVS